MSSRSPGPSAIAVVAILADGDSVIDATLEAAAAQNYEPAAIYVVGSAAEAVSGASDLEGHPNIQSLVDSLDSSVTHVWLLRAGSVPRMDALYALIFESERVDAGLAGSKLLDVEHPDHLLSVGLATDVFDVPYYGLDEDELDAGQYDVLRDVAAVAGASMLARRDLMRGLGGPDRLMPPEAAAIDLSQRARLLGGRVVVVPSSEVAVPPSIAAPEWREEAGRIRAMVKVYSALTLLWALPLRFLVGLLEAVLAPLVGRWTLLRWLRSWLWNMVRIPSTLRARRVIRARAAEGDAELFRFQLRGSATLRVLGEELVDTARSRFPGEERGGVASLASEMRRPAFGIGLAALLFSVAATRQLWSGFPAAGLSLPLPLHGADAVVAYAGGWNPAGFGGTEQLPPFLGFAGLWQQVLFDRPDLAAGSLALLAFLGGIWGVNRLLKTWSINSVPGLIAGVAFMAGPAARTIAGSGDVANLIALGLVPWVLRAALAPWPSGWLRRLARVLTVVWLTGLLGNVSPDAVLVPAGALVVLAIVGVTDRQLWLAAAVGAVGAAGGVLLMRPWIGSVDLQAYAAAGRAFWEPGVLLLVAAVVAAAAVLVAAPDRVWRVGLWGGLVAAVGGVLTRTASEGGGRHLEALGLAAVALGTAIVLGSAFEAVRRAASVDSLRRLAIGLGAVGAAVVALSSLLVIAPGRGGLPADDLVEALRFTGAAVDDGSAARVLLIGPPEALPGTSRRVRGAAYRVISAPDPYLWEVELPEPGPADEALEAVLEELIDGEARRPGAQLAAFGIRWVLALGETPLAATFDGQLDVIPLDGLRRPAFLIEAPNAVRALSADGTAWMLDGTGYAGDPAETVLVREHTDPGWGSDAVTDDWAMTLDGSTGSAVYERRSEGQSARQSLFAGLALVAVSALLRRRRR